MIFYNSHYNSNKEPMGHYDKDRGRRTRARRVRLPKTERPPASALLVCRARVAMAFALVAAVSAHSSMRLTARARMPVATAPQMCTTDKPEAPKEEGAFSLVLREHQSKPCEHVARVLMMVCSASAAEAASLATRPGEVQLGTWERAIAEHAYEGITAKGVLADLIPGYVNRGEALAAVRADGMALKRASPELRADREVVLAAVRQDVRALSHASPELQADRDVVLAAVRKRMMAMLAPVVAQVLAQVCAFYYPSLWPWALCLCVCSYPWLVVPLLRMIL